MRHVEVIAEIGVCHQNDLRIAFELIHQARLAGADVVKFQASTVVEEISIKAAPEHFAEIGALVPTWDFLRECSSYADSIGIEFMCTPAGLESLDFVRNELQCQRLKIASDNLTNIEFLRAASRVYADRPILLSTGMGDMNEIKIALHELSPSIVSRMDITVMHCTSAYPCPADSANLRAIWSMGVHLAQPIGFSDHTVSTVIPAMAVALGATVIEKHMTLNRGWKGPDHAASLEPHDFAAMVANIREAELAVGAPNGKQRLGIEEAGAKLYRKSLVARMTIKAGEPFTTDNLTAKRPGTGIPAANWARYIGYPARHDYAEDQLIDGATE